jgi:hypothetical protein
VAQKWLEENMSFWPKQFWPPSSPDLNLDYSIWVHVQRKACAKRHASVNSLKCTIRKQWNSMDKTYVRSTCQGFRKCLGKVIDANGGIVE